MSQKSQAPSSDKTTNINQIIEQRRAKKDRLAASGKSPYGRRFVRSCLLGEVHKNFDSKIPKSESVPKNNADPIKLTLAGRMMTRRDLGKLCFAHIHDWTGKLQIKISKDTIGPDRYKEFIKDIDIGDFVGVSGTLTRTKTGELSISPESFELLSKSIRPWPEKFHGMTDIETRSRQRDLDIGTNAESLERFMSRSKIIGSLRETLSEKGFIEVETPLMQAVPGGAAAKPFITHHESLDLDLYMRVAPELYLKRLLVGGFDRVYEIGRAFRNEGIDTRHNPEFTILEAYQAFGDVTDMMDLTEDLVKKCASDLGVKNTDYRGEVCDLTKKFERRSLVDLFKELIQLDLIKLCETNGWSKAAQEMKLDLPKGAPDRKCFDLLFDERVLPKLKNPTFVLDYPAIFSPLAKGKAGQPLLTDRFELFVAKEEIANAYTEQNDPDEQSRKFKEELSKRQKGDEEAMPMDAEFILALEHGMPPAGGVGIGIDRLTMVLTGATSIREVILFPLLKPQN